MSDAFKRTGSHAVQLKPAGAQTQSSVRAKQTTVSQSPATNQNGRAPSAPPVYRPQGAPKAVQPKMQTAAVAGGRTSTSAPRAGGVVQANIIGGTHALQARLALWHTTAQRKGAPSSSTSAQDASKKGGQAVARHRGAQAVQCKSGPGVEAFKVPLRPKSGGYPLPDNVRAKMESAFATDFSDVRVHVGQEAASIGAIAYTWGTNIHFASGQYNPHTIQGQKLLGHELWHVVQQKSGRVKNPFGGGVAVVQDHALEAEADRMGIKAAMSAPVSLRKDD
jgi:hypothetical protein